MLRVLALLCFLIFAGPAPASDVDGSWALTANGVTIMRFNVARLSVGWSATWTRPEHFQTDGYSFSKLTGPIIHRASASTRKIKDGLELTFDDPQPGDTPDVFQLMIVDGDHAVAIYEGLNTEPFALVRVPRSEPVGPFNPAESYTRTVDRPTNSEMTAIYDADQAARQVQPIDWTKVEVDDAKRKARTQVLLDGGKLASGDDYLHAAFLFQHGDSAADYLKAHLLAMIAIARGRPGAVWIAAATLDRYLLTIKQPQVLGTQFQGAADGSSTQEPYDRTMVSDAVRAALRVPSLAEQDEQREEHDRQAKAPKP